MASRPHTSGNSRDPLWLTDGVIVTQDPRRRVFRGALRIQDGVITDIKRSLPVSARRERRESAAGLHLLPGFVQAHLHLCQTLFRNLADDLELLDWLRERIWVLEAAHTAETLKISAELGIHELLASGTTCILDMGTVRHTEAILEAVHETGIRASVGKCLMDHPRTTPPALREPAARALAEARALHARWDGRAGGRIGVSYAPRFVVACTDPLLKEVARLSREQGALIHTHASENRKEIQLVRRMTGHPNIEHLHRLGLTSERLVLAHCVWIQPEEIRLLRRMGSHVVHCPSSNLKLASGIAPIPRLLRAGVNVALGADGAPCNNSLNAFQEMRLAALLHKPGHGPLTLKAQEVLDLATLGGARALGWADRIGSLEVGKQADVIGLRLGRVENLIAAGDEESAPAVASAIVYASNPAHVAFTRVAGRILARNGRVPGLPLEPLLARARKAQITLRRALRKR